MYFWRVDKLVEDFRNDNVSEKDKLKYMLLLGVIMTLATDPILWIGSQYSIMDAINLPLMLLVVVAGTYYCYVANRDADNKDFITRFMCLGVPILVRILVIAVPVFIVIVVVEEIFGVGQENTKAGDVVYSTTVSQVAGGVLFLVVYYLYLGNKLKSVATDSHT